MPVDDRCVQHKRHSQTQHADWAVSSASCCYHSTRKRHTAAGLLDGLAASMQPQLSPQLDAPQVVVQRAQSRRRCPAPQMLRARRRGCPRGHAVLEREAQQGDGGGGAWGAGRPGRRSCLNTPVHRMYTRLHHTDATSTLAADAFMDPLLVSTFSPAGQPNPPGRQARTAAGPLPAPAAASRAGPRPQRLP